MVELDDVLKDCLIAANDNFPDLDMEEMVIHAIQEYVFLTGGPIHVEDDEEGIELLNKCVAFLIDCTLFNLIEKGLVEFAGLSEDGEMTFSRTIEL